MRLFLLLLVNIIFFISCKKYNPADSAFFIKPSSVSVFVPTSLKQTQGSNNSKITDLWVYVNGQFQGAYPTDHLIPIVNKNAKAKIEILAGIKNNGISGTRIFWSMYDKIQLDTLVESGKTIDRPLVFNYNPYTTFALNETFDSSSGYYFKKSDASDTSFSTATSADWPDGNFLTIGLAGKSVVAQVESNLSYSLTAGSENVYLELNYKCNEAFSVGLIGDGNPQAKEAIVINPQETWNKIYIQLSLVVSSAPVSSKYKVYFRMIKKDGTPKPYLFLDNIKLVYL